MGDNTTMAYLVKQYAPVWQATACLLLAPGLEGILCSYDDLISLLNTMHGVRHNINKYALIDEPLLIKFFTWREERTSIRYTLNYSQMHIVSSGAEEKQYLHVSKDCCQVCHLIEKDIVQEVSGIGSLLRPANGVFDSVVMTHPLKTPYPSHVFFPILSLMMFRMRFCHFLRRRWVLGWLDWQRMRLE